MHKATKQSMYISIIRNIYCIYAHVNWFHITYTRMSVAISVQKCNAIPLS